MSAYAAILTRCILIRSFFIHLSISAFELENLTHLYLMWLLIRQGLYLPFCYLFFICPMSFCFSVLPLLSFFVLNGCFLVYHLNFLGFFTIYFWIIFLVLIPGITINISILIVRKTLLLYSSISPPFMLLLSQITSPYMCAHQL